MPQHGVMSHALREYVRQSLQFGYLVREKPSLVRRVRTSDTFQQLLPILPSPPSALNASNSSRPSLHTLRSLSLDFPSRAERVKQSDFSHFSSALHRPSGQCLAEETATE